MKNFVLIALLCAASLAFAGGEKEKPATTQGQGQNQTQSQGQNAVASASAGSSATAANDQVTSFRQVRQAVPAIAPDVFSYGCRAGYGAGVGSTLGGLSFGGSKRDEQCEIEKAALLFSTLGYTRVALKIACGLDAAKKYAGPGCAETPEPVVPPEPSPETHAYDYIKPAAKLELDNNSAPWVNNAPLVLSAPTPTITQWNATPDLLINDLGSCAAFDNVCKAKLDAVVIFMKHRNVGLLFVEAGTAAKAKQARDYLTANGVSENLIDSKTTAARQDSSIYVYYVQ